MTDGVVQFGCRGDIRRDMVRIRIGVGLALAHLIVVGDFDFRVDVGDGNAGLALHEGAPAGTRFHSGKEIERQFVAAGGDDFGDRSAV